MKYRKGRELLKRLLTLIDVCMTNNLKGRIGEFKARGETRTQALCDIYYTTQAVRGPITKINQSKCSITGPIFSKYWTGHCPE